MTTADLSLPLLVALPASDYATDPETARLIAQARAGERDAFGELLERHLPAARRVALAALGRHADADEAVQDASIAAWRRLESLTADAAFRAWFLRIVWRKALDRRRSLRAWMDRFRSEVDEHGAFVHEPSSAEAGPEAAVLATELERAAASVVCALPRRLRDPFLLAASGDHRYEEIAVMLAMPVGSVKWRVSEARKMIRAKLGRLGLGDFT